MIETIGKENICPKVFETFTGKEVEWDYRKFDLEYANYFFKDEIYKI